MIANRCRTSLVLSVVLAGVCVCEASAATFEGVYRVTTGSDRATIKVMRAGATFVGVVLDGTSAWHTKQIGQTVLQFTRVGGGYAGWYSPYHTHSSIDPAERRRLFSVRVGDRGMCCTRETCGGGKTWLLYRRIQWNDDRVRPEPSIAGEYVLDGVSGDRAWVQIRPGRPGGLYDFVGVVVKGTSEWHKKQIGRAVLFLNKVGRNAYYGRYSLYHFHGSHDTNLLCVLRAAHVTKGRGLFVTIEDRWGARSNWVYRSSQPSGGGTAQPNGGVSQPAPGQPSSQPQQIPPPTSRNPTGRWKGPNWTLRVRYNDRSNCYEGFLETPSAYQRSLGFRPGERTLAEVRWSSQQGQGSKAAQIFTGKVKWRYRNGRVEWKSIKLRLSPGGEELRAFRVNSLQWKARRIG